MTLTSSQTHFGSLFNQLYAKKRFKAMRLAKCSGAAIPGFNNAFAEIVMNLFEFINF